MHITFSASAIEQLSPYISDGTKKLKLLHDTEGCGCVVSGVPALQLVQETSVDDKLTKGDPFPFLYEPRHEIYYEPNLRINYDPDRESYSLKSDNQIYTLNLRFIQS
ncbi:MAG: iron-sulfur cluster biosynthesis family protein [Candidatus Pristimantibacillus sp.]